MKQAKQRVIYSNYDLWEDYAADAREILGQSYDPDDITEDMIWNIIYDEAAVNWECDFSQLQEFFAGDQWIITGTVGRWCGPAAAGAVFDDFERMFSQATKDCDYWKIWDENGHLFLKCSHHDGTNIFEIKRITERGAALLDKWEYDLNDHRSEAELHQLIMNCNLFSALPHYAHQVFGCAKREAG